MIKASARLSSAKGQKWARLGVPPLVLESGFSAKPSAVGGAAREDISTSREAVNCLVFEKKKLGKEGRNRVTLCGLLRFPGKQA